MNYQFYRNSLIQLSIPSIFIPFEVYDSWSKSKSVENPNILVCMTIVDVVALSFLLYKTIKTKRLEEKGLQVKPEVPASKIRREKERRFLLYLMTVGGLFITVIGFQGDAINFIPAHYLGLPLFGYGLLGACGVNIWARSQLDPRFDPPE